VPLIDTPGEKLLIRIWETAEKFGIGICRPRQLRRERIAIAEVDRLRRLALAQAEKEAADIESGIHSDSEATVVNTRWVNQSPASGDQDVVIHWVPDRDNSYLRKKWPSVQIAQNASGHTYIDKDMTGSEFYRRPRLQTPSAYAKIAAHEAMHNITGLGNQKLHGQRGLAGDGAGTPHLPVTDNDKTLVPNQLL
jgi:hypothetical protein